VARILIPDAVARELCAAAAPPAVSGWVAHLPEWATVTLVTQEQIATITDDLDLGERAAIALAGAIRADLLLIDDAAGRVEAKRRNLRVTGTLGVLRVGAEQGVVNVPDMLQKLRTTSFYADEALIKVIFHKWLRPT